jgi:hypothetical protein
MIWTTDITVRCGKSNEVGQMTTDKIRKFKEIRRLITRELRFFWCRRAVLHEAEDIFGNHTC